MTRIIYIESNGGVHETDVPAGLSVMEGAIQNNVPGIDADCGGACACATCHVYVDETWTGRTGTPNPTEDSMLDFVQERTDRSRLSCQIRIDDALDGLIVHLPETQS